MSDKPRYCHKCKAWHAAGDAGWKTGCVSELAAPTLLGFDNWWHHVGSGLPPNVGEDGEEHAMRVCRLAWNAAEHESETKIKELKQVMVGLRREVEHQKNRVLAWERVASPLAHESKPNDELSDGPSKT